LALDASAMTPSLRHNQPLLFFSLRKKQSQGKEKISLIKEDIKPNHTEIRTKTRL
jgi:hypothetical protein